MTTVLRSGTAGLGVGLYLLGVAFFSLNDALGKWLVADYGVGQLMMLRSIGAVIVTALSAPLLGEKVERFRWIAVMVGFAGVVIALRPSPQMVSFAAPIALFGAVMFALNQ